MGGGSKKFGNPGGRGGSKILPSMGGGVEFFWNNPICALQNSLQQNVTSITENQQGS